MDTITCETCSCEILPDNVDPHFDWHKRQDEALDGKLSKEVFNAQSDRPDM
jgi:hypothetical protein